MITPVTKRGLSYSWEMVAVEVSEEIIRMGFIQTEGLTPCTRAIRQLQPAAAEVTSRAAPEAAVESVLETPPKSELYRVIAWANVTKKWEPQVYLTVNIMANSWLIHQSLGFGFRGY